MKNWWTLNFKEISNSQSLRYFAIFLSLLHIYNAFLWSSSLAHPASDFLSLCWGIWPNCKEIFSVTSSLTMIKVYGGLAFIALLGLFFRKTFHIAASLLLITFLLKIFIYLSQYSLKDNVHAFLFFVELCFFFLPQKARCIKWLTIANFITIGLFKLNTIWLSGYWLSEHFPDTPMKVLEWTAFFILLIQVFAPLGLLSFVGQVFVTSFTILFAYSLLTFVYLDRFQSFLYLVLLVLFPLSIREQKKRDQSYIYNSNTRKESHFLWAWAGLLAFITIQVSTYFYSRSHSSPSRFILSIEPRPAPSECRQDYVVQLGHSVFAIPSRKQVSPIQQAYCHKDYALKNTQKLCQEYLGLSESIKVSTKFYQRSVLKKEWQSSFFKYNACAEQEGNP